MLILSLIYRLGSPVELITKVADEFAPAAISSFVELYIDEIVENGKLSMTIVSAIILLWSASRGIFAIIGGLNSVYEIKESRLRRICSDSTRRNFARKIFDVFISLFQRGLSIR